MWNLYENEKPLEPLVFSNGKTQADIVKEVIDAINQGYKIIFIKGVCGSGKSAIALNLAKKLGKTSIVVPIKSLQEQYIKDYAGQKYVLKNEINDNENKVHEKLKIASITGRQNFKCKFIEEFNNRFNFQSRKKEKNMNLDSLFKGFDGANEIKIEKSDDSCDNNSIPCKIEIKEKNIEKLKDYIRENPSINIGDFESVNEIKRMSIAPVCPYWSPVYSETFEIKKFKDSAKTNYMGLNNKKFVIYHRKDGCPYYGQYKLYADSDVIIFNSLKYLIETLMDRKPATELEIIDECDEFLDNFTIEERINLNKVLFYLNNLFTSNEDEKIIIDDLIDIVNAIKISDKFKKIGNILELEGTLIEELLEKVLENNLIDIIGDDESNYLYHLDKVARIFHDFFDETFVSIEKDENNMIISLVTTNLEKRFKEILEKNKIFIMMSGTIHSENVLRNVFGIDNFKIVEAETKPLGELIKCRYGYELDCSYESFKKGKINREQYLKALSKCVSCAKPPTLVHINSFSDLPTDEEKITYNIYNLPTRQEIRTEQQNDPFGKRISEFKKGKTNILFTTKCNRGIDFPGEMCNSIIITRFPYPDISSIFWKIFKKTKPEYFMSFYMDKSKREILQRIYRGLRSQNDKVYLLSPDIRVLDSNIF